MRHSAVCLMSLRLDLKHGLFLSVFVLSSFSIRDAFKNDSRDTEPLTLSRPCTLQRVRTAIYEQAIAGQTASLPHLPLSWRDTGSTDGTGRHASATAQRPIAQKFCPIRRQKNSRSFWVNFA